MKIEDIIKVEKKDPRDYFLFEVHIEGEELPFLVAKSEMAEFGLHKGSYVNFTNRKELLDMILLRRGKGIAVRAVTKRNLTEKELLEKLTIREIPGSIAEEILKWLKELRIMSDEAYAENFINYRGKRKSKKELMFALTGKGIEKSKVLETLEKNNFDEQPQATLLAEKKLRSVYQGESELKEIQKKDIEKIIGYLFRKGYPLDVCKKAISEAFENISRP